MIWLVKTRLLGVKLAPGKRSETNLDEDGWSTVASYREKERAVRAVNNIRACCLHLEANVVEVP
jgi:hypothetical protein